MLLALLFHLPFRPTHHDLSTGGPQKFATRHSISTPETFCNSEHCKVLGLSHTELTGSRSLTHRDDLTHESSRAGTEFGHYMNHSGERGISRPICKSTSSSMDACGTHQNIVSDTIALLTRASQRKRISLTRSSASATVTGYHGNHEEIPSIAPMHRHCCVAPASTFWFNEPKNYSQKWFGDCCIL
jgi:hypothetical protein